MINTTLQLKQYSGYRGWKVFFFKLQLAGSGILVNSFHLDVEFLNVKFFSLFQEKWVLFMDFINDGEGHITD